jgi:hypothetical protein
MCKPKRSSAPPLSILEQERLALALEDRSEFVSAGDIIAGSITIARAYVSVALNMIAVKAPPDVQKVAEAAIAAPSTHTFNELVRVSAGQAWEDLLTDALAALALARVSELLSDGR